MREEPSDEWLQRHDYTRETYAQSCAKFGWNDGDIRWLDDDGNVLTTEQVKKMQAEAAAERASNGDMSDVDRALYEFDDDEQSPAAR